MPLLRPCAGGCGTLVTKGRCPACAREPERRRGSAHQRGYGTAWEAFRLQFLQMLLDHGIVPCCGAVLPTGPKTTDSQCLAQGYQTAEGLHLDHEPPLQDWERRYPEKVCDPNRIQLLCGPDHSAKTIRDRGESKCL